MEIINRVKKAYKIIKGDTEEKKLDIILNHVIDSIELRGDVVHIKTNKNIAIENDGHVVTINSGMNVTLAKEIHFNPNIDFSDANFDELTDRIEKDKEEQSAKLQDYMNNPPLQFTQTVPC